MTIRLREAPATVAEQRARLPPAAECESEVAGKWKALVYSEATASWYEYLMEVRHVEGSATALTGVIYVDAWTGGPTDPEPGQCHGNRRMKGKQKARGTFTGGEVAFGGQDFELQEILCGDRNGIGYNPDQFTGRLEKERHEFQSVNNDGGAAVNEPSVFRRIGCFDDEARQNPDVKPPPFFPARSEGGC
ncbi:MAG TPA: hypothetical protein VK698_33480 [Kofleriaceae bacterium]|nr:hypothetical protein [Kofleriaceae bacterium]